MVTGFENFFVVLQSNDMALWLIIRRNKHQIFLFLNGSNFTFCCYRQESFSVEGRNNLWTKAMHVFFLQEQPEWQLFIWISHEKQVVFQLALQNKFLLCLRLAMVLPELACPLNAMPHILSILYFTLPCKWWREARVLREWIIRAIAWWFCVPDACFP